MTGKGLLSKFIDGILMLFMPRYSFIEFLNPKNELDELTQVAISIGLSLVLVVPAGLVVSYKPFSIRLFRISYRG
jgi:uncharacterized membrane protein